MAFIELRRPCRRRHVRCSGGSRFYYDLWIIVHIMNERIFLKLFSFHSEAEIISDCLRNGFWFLVCFWFSGFARVKTSWCPLLSSSKVWIEPQKAEQVCFNFYFRSRIHLFFLNIINCSLINGRRRWPHQFLLNLAPAQTRYIYIYIALGHSQTTLG